MGCMAIAVNVLAPCSGWAQSASPSLGVREQPAALQAPPAVQAPPAIQAPPGGAPAPTRSDGPGLVDELGKFFEKMSILPSSSDSRSGAPEASGDAGKPAADGAGGSLRSAITQSGEALSRLTKPSSMVSGRSPCPLAANGTPDCKAAAEKLCQGKGYKEGKSLNTDAAESCSARVLIPGRQRKPGDCRTDTYVTSALCQ